MKVYLVYDKVEYEYDVVIAVYASEADAEQKVAEERRLHGDHYRTFYSEEYPLQ